MEFNETCPLENEHRLLEMALIACESKSIQELLDNKISTDHLSCNCLSNTPLIIATGIAFFSEQLKITGNIDPVKQLLLAGADITEQHNGQLPVELAILSHHKKYLAVEPTDPIAYLKNPTQYKKDHPEEFDPVKKYPNEFENERQWVNNWQLQKLQKKYGSLVNYLRLREISYIHSQN